MYLVLLLLTLLHPLLHPPHPSLKLSDGRGGDPGEQQRDQSDTGRQPEEEKEEGHQLFLPQLHGSDLRGVRAAHGGAGRQRSRHPAAGRGFELDGGAGDQSGGSLTCTKHFTSRHNNPVTFAGCQVKAQVWLKAVTLNLCPDFYQRFCPDHCILLYQKKGSVCEIYDKHQVFQTLDCIRYWRGAGAVPKRRPLTGGGGGLF